MINLILCIYWPLANFHHLKWKSTSLGHTVYPKKYAHGFCFAVLCCGYTLTDFPISIRLTSLALWQSNDCPSASKATLMNMDKYFMWIHYERLHNHNKAKHNKTVCIFLGIYCIDDGLFCGLTLSDLLRYCCANILCSVKVLHAGCYMHRWYVTSWWKIHSTEDLVISLSQVLSVIFVSVIIDME